MNSTTEDDAMSMDANLSKEIDSWPDRPECFPQILNPVEAAQFLRLDEVGHNPVSAKRTLDYWRSRGELKATKYGRHVWYMREQLEAFLKMKTES